MSDVIKVGEPGVTTTDRLIILAIILGPLLAILIGYRLDTQQEARQRQMDIFQTLMVTEETSLEHKRALTTINFEFDNSESNEKEVLSALSAYRDLLDKPPPTPASRSDDALFNKTRVELHTDLLHKMAISLKYDFNSTYIKNSRYNPKGTEEETIAQSIIKILNGEKSLPVHITRLPVSYNKTPITRTKAK